MAKYRCKPVEVDAVRGTAIRDGDISQLPEWLHDAFKKGVVKKFTNSESGESGIAIKTLEGTVFTSFDSWIVRGELGEIWPIQNEQFDHKYERVES